MYVSIDRFEENIAVCQKYNGEMLNIEKSKIPSHAKEGDVLLIHGNEIIIDQDETMKRKREIEKMVEDLWE